MSKRKLAIAAGAAIAVVGAGSALAAAKLSPQGESTAVVADAAEQLGVAPEELTEALKSALKNTVDAAVEAGRLTEVDGAALKGRIERSDVPLFAGPLLDRDGHAPHLGGPRIALDAAASYLGLGEGELREEVREGRSLADVARARGKSVDGLVDALVEAAEKRLDEAVAEGAMTPVRRAELVRRLESRMTAAVDAERPRGFGRRLPGFGAPHDA